MANTEVLKRRIDPEQFKRVIGSKGYSVRSLGGAGICDERTLRRILRDRCAAVSLLYRLASYLETDFETLCGPDESFEWQDFIRKAV